jgi:hypothetical protein
VASWLIAPALLALAAGGSGILAWLAREARRPWAVVAAVVGGEGAVEGIEADLRFWAVAAALSLGVATWLLVPWGGAVSLLAGVPLWLAVLVLGAEGLSRSPVWRLSATRAKERTALMSLLERAQDQVRQARIRVSEHRRAVVETLEEELSGYALALQSDELDGLRERIEGVLSLARSCMVAEGRDAARLLGVRLDASPAETRAVFQALQGIYEGPGALPGAAPDKGRELACAYERLELRFALQDSAGARQAA